MILSNFRKTRTKDRIESYCIGYSLKVCIANPLNEKITGSNQVVFPACINIHRCDGCCPQDEKCVATNVTTVRMKNVRI